MVEESANVQGIFSSIARNYDRLNSILTLNIDQLWRKKAIKLCQIVENERVLDVCCGTGKMMELECSAVGEGTAVTGLDFNGEMLAVAGENLGRSSAGYRYALIQGDATELPFEDDTFHCVTIAFGIRNVPDKTKAIAEMYRVLKPGGRVVCLELSKPEMPGFKSLYNLYFAYGLPVIGYLGTGDKAAYHYLRDSVNGFMTKEQLKSEFERAGFESVGFESLTLGIASIHYGVKGSAIQTS